MNLSILNKKTILLANASILACVGALIINITPAYASVYDNAYNTQTSIYLNNTSCTTKNYTDINDFYETEIEPLNITALENSFDSGAWTLATVGAATNITLRIYVVGSNGALNYNWNTTPSINFSGGVNSHNFQMNSSCNIVHSTVTSHNNFVFSNSSGRNVIANGTDVVFNIPDPAPTPVPTSSPRPTSAPFDYTNSFTPSQTLQLGGSVGAQGDDPACGIIHDLKFNWYTFYMNSSQPQERKDSLNDAIENGSWGANQVRDGVSGNYSINLFWSTDPDAQVNFTNGTAKKPIYNNTNVYKISLSLTRLNTGSGQCDVVTYNNYSHTVSNSTVPLHTTSEGTHNGNPFETTTRNWITSGEVTINYPTDYNGEDIRQTAIAPTTIKPIIEVITGPDSATFQITHSRGWITDNKDCQPTYNSYLTFNIGQDTLTWTLGETRYTFGEADYAVIEIPLNPTTANAMTYKNMPHGTYLIGSEINTILTQYYESIFVGEQLISLGCTPEEMQQIQETDFQYETNTLQFIIDGQSRIYNENTMDCDTLDGVCIPISDYEDCSDYPKWQINFFTCVIGNGIKGIQNAFIGLFVPRPQVILNHLSTLDNFFESKLGFLYYPFSFVINTATKITSSAATPQCTHTFGNWYQTPFSLNICSESMPHEAIYNQILQFIRLFAIIGFVYFALSKYREMLTNRST